MFESFFLLYGIIQSIIIPYYLIKIYNDDLFNIITILINGYFIILMAFQYYYKILSIFSKSKRKYKYYLESSKFYKQTIGISFASTLIYLIILLNIYVKHDFDSKKFTQAEYDLTRVMFVALVLFIIIIVLTYLYSILASKG